MNRILVGIFAGLLLCAGIIMGVVAIAATGYSETVVVNNPIQSASSATVKVDKAPAGWLTEYQLTERSGRKFRSEELKGKVHVVNFFFAKCPTSCRIQTAAVKGLHDEFGPKGVVFISITCDPENDTPVALAEYAKEFRADPKQWLFLTGDLPYIRRVGGEVYYLPVDKQTHSESLLLVDRQGKIHGRFSWKDATELAKMKQAMNDLLSDVGPDPSPDSST
jgi:protein SCO1/2